MTVQAGLCQTWLESQIVGFLMKRLISMFQIVPPNQAETMYKAVKAKGLPTAYVLFKGIVHNCNFQNPAQTEMGV